MTASRTRLVVLLALAMLPRAAAADASVHFGPPFLVTGEFAHPFGVGVDSTHGRLLVADTGNRRFRWTAIADLTGTYTFTEHGFVADADAADALVGPEAIAADAQGNVYVVNTFRNEVQQYRWNEGAYQLNAAFCAGSGNVVNGLAIELPRDVAVGADGLVYLLDSGNNRILVAAGADATSWTLLTNDAAWRNPYGLAVDAAGTVYVADTGNHRIVKRKANGESSSFGHFGTGLGEFRFPRDVAVDQHGRLFVADTVNHRIQVLAADLHPLLSLGQAPAVGTLDKLAIDDQGRLFASDSDNDRIVAFLGAATVRPFDPYLRDFVGDDGSEPSDSHFQISSPDILVRHQPDVDIAAVAQNGLESIVFQQPRFDEDNYVYIALRNRGTQPSADNFVRAYWYDPHGAGTFPAHWSTAGFFTGWDGKTANKSGNTLHAAVVGPGGASILGPLRWRPPAPESTVMKDGMLRLAVRVNNPYDEPPTGDATTMARDSNSVSERRVLVLRGPFSVGEQNTLVLRVHYPDLAAQTDEIDVLARANAAAAWIDEVSYGLAPVTVSVRGPVTLPHLSASYNAVGSNVLVTMAHDALAALLDEDPAALDGGIDRVVLVTNEFGSDRDWATTGAWPYTHGGITRYLTVSVQAADNAAPLFGHGLAHQLSLTDLYAHEGVTFPMPYADRWDNMAKPFDNAHPLVWSKEQAYWVTGRDAKILYVPRPAAGAAWNNGGAPIHLHHQATAAPDETVGVAFGLSNGVTAFSDETAFYYVESRRRDAAPADADLPGDGVLMYYANRQIPQGQGPVIVRDHVAGGTLDDAAIPIGASEAPEGTGISVVVQDGTAGADIDLAVQYAPPSTDYDVFMEPGDPPWSSPDIWVDNQQDGYDETNDLAPADRGNLGIAGEENRVYARIANHGPAVAFDAEVSFAFSEPFHTLGDETEFVEFKSVFLDQVTQDVKLTPFVTWTPQPGIEPHTCVRVELRRVFDDTNAANNVAQRNLDLDHSVHGSPYTPVTFRFSVSNPDTQTKPVYFRAEGVPAGWSATFSPDMVVLAANARGEGLLVLQPPDDAPDCTSHEIRVTSWLPRGDTLVRLGGTTVSVDLQRKTLIDVDAKLGECSVQDRIDLREKLGDVAGCARIVVQGCTQPPMPNQQIVLRYEGPDGEPIYHTVTTDGNGCYQDFNLVASGGDWQAQADFPGTACAGPAIGSDTVDVPLPITPPVDPLTIDPGQRVCLAPFATAVQGKLDRLRPEGAKPARCRERIASLVGRLLLQPTPAADDQLPPDAAHGTIEFPAARLLIDQATGEAMLRGRFTWHGGGNFVATGQASGVIVRDGGAKREWRVDLLATVATGAFAGQRIRASVLLQSAPLGAGPLALAGSIRGEFENLCGASPALMKVRVDAARHAATLPPERPCPGSLPCLLRVDRTGRGSLRLDQTAFERCTQPSCSTRKTWESLRLRLPAANDGAREHADLGTGEMVVPKLVTVHRHGRQQGEQGGAAQLRFTNGNVAEGEFTAIATLAPSSTNGATSPVHADEAWRTGQRRDAPPLERAVDMAGHFRGRFVAGPLKGAQLELGIALASPAGVKRSRQVDARIDGWLVQGCLGVTPKHGPDATPSPPDDRPPVQPPPLLRPVLDPRRYRALSELPPATVAAVRRAVGPGWSERDEKALRIGDRRFREADRNGDGTLDETEFASLFPSLAGKRAAAPARTRFDADHDGRIDATEFALWWRSLPSLAPVKPPP